jgi:hypothetical protein
MSDLDQKAQITLLKHTLGSTCQDLYTQYSQLKGTQADAINNNKILTSQKVNLTNKLEALRTEADTLNQEYLDRSQGGSPTLLQRYGLSTQQDWILFLFFFSYGFMCLVFIIFILQRSAAKMQGVVIFIMIAVVIGITIAGTLTVIA